MKKLFLALLITSGFACNGNSEGTGDEPKNMDTKTEAVDNTPSGNSSSDTTPTSNNNAYNTDSASGQSTTYDTSSNNKKQ